MKKRILIGGAWPYANYYLHVGHLAALLPGDILARYFRGCGDEVLYVSGSDCHGTPITERAKKEGTTPFEIANFYHNEFKKTFEKLGFTYDLYAATMDEEHKKYVKDVFLTLYNNGYIYEKEVLQDYCENCKTFLSDREIVGKCPICGGVSTGDQCDECLASLDSDKVLDKKCKTCGKEVTLKNNKHLYFKLSAFTDVLKELIESHKDIWRKNAYGESNKYLNMGLIDRAATRQLDWGIEVPVEGYEDKRIYVWIEAVLGYLSDANRVLNARGEKLDEFMSNDDENLKVYFVHGKDNIPFHSVIYPALVAGMNKNYRLVDYMISSAYVNINSEKMSKSKGNLITANELLEMFDVDTLRYYFIANGPEVKDINCSLLDIVQVHNKFLVGVIGNFVNRNLSFINKKFDGVIKEAKIDEDIIKKTKEIYEVMGNLISKGEFRSAANALIDYVTDANKYYDTKEPWILAKENIEEFNNVTYTCTYIIANIANLIAPIMPNSSLLIKDMLSLNEFKWEEESIKGDIKINNLRMLFNRIDEEKFKEEHELN